MKLYQNKHLSLLFFLYFQNNVSKIENTILILSTQTSASRSRGETASLTFYIRNSSRTDTANGQYGVERCRA